jgi:DNA-binding FadR family transcriptional regulator
VADIYQMRRALEPELAASLAGTLTEDQIAELQGLAERYPEPAKSAEEEKEQHIASLVFHARLSEFAENKLLGFVIGFMANILTDMTVYRQLYDPPNVVLWSKGREHQLALVEALRAGQAEEARRIMASHMQIAEELMKVQEAHLLRRFMGD